MEGSEVVAREGEDVDCVEGVVGRVDHLLGVVCDEVVRIPLDSGWPVSEHCASGVHSGVSGGEGALEQRVGALVHHNVRVSGRDDSDTPEVLPRMDHDLVPHLAVSVRDAHADHLGVARSNQDLSG